MAQNELSKKRNLGYQIKELSKKGLSYRKIEKKLRKTIQNELWT